MRTRLPVLAATTLLALGATSAAAPAAAAPSHAEPNPGARSITAPRAVPGATARGAGTAKTCNNQDMSGCFTFAQTKQVVDYSVKYVARAVNTMYPRLPKPKSFWYVPHRKTYRWCTTTMTDMTFGYCFLDHTIALGQRQVWDFYDRAGDAAPLVGVAHEYAHHIQVVTKVPLPRTPRQSVRFENQADCLAGAIVRQLRRDRIFTDQDLRDVDDLIPMIASAEGSDRDHGTLRERVDAIYLGIRYGARTCSRYVPGSRVG